MYFYAIDFYFSSFMLNTQLTSLYYSTILRTIVAHNYYKGISLTATKPLLIISSSLLLRCFISQYNNNLLFIP